TRRSACRPGRAFFRKGTRRTRCGHRDDQPVESHRDLGHGPLTFDEPRRTAMFASHDAVAAFEQARPALLGLAYRILGSRADAEDAVQDTFLKWQADDRSDIATPGAWLATVCTRHCLDLLRSAERARVDYIGPWLPEPVQTANDDTPEQ